MDQLHWGVIGTIEKARAFAADLPYASEHHILHTILTDESSKADSLQPNEAQHLYSDLQEFLQSDIDAVYIASPHHLHYAQVKQCLISQVPVLCERPIAENTDELKHLIELSETQDTFMMEGMWIRFLPMVKRVLGIVSSGVIGEIVSIKASINHKSGNTGLLNEDREGILITLGTYPVFLCVLFLGRPDFVQATGNKANTGSNEFFSSFFSYAEGQYAFIEASNTNRTGSQVTIEGERGVIVIKNPWNYKPEQIEVDLFDGKKELYKADWEGRGFQFEADEVFKCLQEDFIESELYSHQFTLDVMQTMDDIRQKLK